MKRLLLLTTSFLAAIALPLSALQTGGVPGSAAEKRQAREGDASPRAGNDGAAPGGEKEKPRTINIDALLLYGQYDRILWDASVTQSFKRFTYQLNSDFNRSDDFGRRNSRFYDNGIGFTGTAELSDSWKLTPEVEIDNESRGMFGNPFYRREEKNRLIMNIRNTYQPRPFRWDINLSGTYFTHRFDRSLFPDPAAWRGYHSGDLYRLGAEIGWQYIISAANKLTFNSKFAQYSYSGRSDNDTWTANELIWNFNVGETFKFGVGPLYAYNRDGGHFVSGRVDAATVNIRFFSISASYLYELVPFEPESYYFDQRYVTPVYSLSPGRGHHATLTMGVDAGWTSDAPLYVKKLKCRATGSFRTDDHYYSFFSLPEQTLAPHLMKIAEALATGEAAIGFAIRSAYAELGGRYRYTYFYASDYVTYRPEHEAGGYLRVTAWRIETEFATSWRGRMPASPFLPLTMKPALTGSLSLQVRVWESLFLYGRIDNLYDSSYSTVYGYPEQGRTVIGGLRIII